MSPCPHSGASTERGEVDRREFVKTALVIGGANALAAVRARAHGDGHGDPPGGTEDPSMLPDRQYAWNDYSETNPVTGLAKTPKHHLQFMLEYTGCGEPSYDDRQQVEHALSTLERAFEWSNEGLLFTIGYSPSYFDRFDEDLPEETGLERPERIIEETDIERSGSIEVADYDAHMHLASDTTIALLEAEEALFGDLDAVNGVEVSATFEGVFEKKDRRTGFIGNPHEQFEENFGGDNPIPEDAPVWFGYKSLFEDSQPTEDDVAITDPDHPFENATTEEVSVLRDGELRSWHDTQDTDEKVARMFSPHHSSEETGPHGRELGETSGTDEETMVEIAAQTKEDAGKEQVVGHAQKLARARKGEDNTPPLLRRDFPSTDGTVPRTQFISNQRTIQDFIDVRRAMAFVNKDEDDPDAAAELPLENHGIQGHFKVESRGAFLVPDRSLRALPPADPDDGCGWWDDAEGWWAADYSDWVNWWGGDWGDDDCEDDDHWWGGWRTGADGSDDHRKTGARRGKSKRRRSQ